MRFVGNFKEANGKTIKENNLSIDHKIPIGSLVEIYGEDDDFSWNGCRLFVLDYHRDCDGTPLYILGHKDATEQWEKHNGFCDESLRVVEDK